MQCLPKLIAHNKCFTSLTPPEQDSEMVPGPSDLIPGEYEGGFKIWEASVDLVQYMQTALDYDWNGKRVVEVCGGEGILGTVWR